MVFIILLMIYFINDFSIYDYSNKTDYARYLMTFFMMLVIDSFDSDWGY